MTLEITLRQQVLRRIGALELERSTWLSHWADINRVLLPRTGQFFVTQANKGNRRNEAILDNTGTKALATLGAGMHSGLTSPARPWLKLETSDPDLMEVSSISTWLDQVTQRLLTIFGRSNFYPTVHAMYEELGAYGTAATIMLPDFRNVVHCYPLTVGEYCISANYRGEVDTLCRHYQMTVGQIVEQYVRKPNGDLDWSRTSPQVKNLWDNHQPDSWIPLRQLIEPRRDRDTRKMDRLNMPFRSVVIEDGGEDGKTLYEGGYRRFPALVPRWVVNGQDIYGSSCPGMVALGDINQLQHEQLRKGQGIDYLTNPPLQVPTSLKNQDSDFLPGGVTYYDPAGGPSATAGIQNAFKVDLNLQHLLMDIQDVRQRVNSAFYADLFLFLTSIEGMRGQKTAREIAEIHEEKLLMLGPTIENLGNGLLHPAVDIAFDAAMEAGLLPPPPEELQGEDLRVELIGVLAQAQRSVAMSGVDRIIGATASIAAAKQDPSVWDKINTDNVIDKAAGYLGVDPELIRGDDEVGALREQRAQAQRAAEQQAAAAQAAETAKNLAASDMSTDNALSNVVQSFSGG